MGKKNIWITKFAQDYTDSQSFEFPSFTEAKYKLFHRIGLCKKYITFDRLSLCIYKHNLSNNEYQQFCKEVTCKYNPENKEHKKRRVEYGRLFHYLWCESKLDKYSIHKQERPDFVLNIEDHSVGVEITELTTPYEKVMEKISSIPTSDTSVDELKLKAKKRHGQKVNDYSYYEINDSVSVGTKTLDLTEIKKLFISHIIEKYNKYEKDIDSFDNFIILCDAQHGITITSKDDINNLLEGLLDYSYNKKFCVAILWIDFNNRLNCTQHEF